MKITTEEGTSPKGGLGIRISMAPLPEKLQEKNQPNLKVLEHKQKKSKK